MMTGSNTLKTEYIAHTTLEKNIVALRDLIQDYINSRSGANTSVTPTTEGNEGYISSAVSYLISFVPNNPLSRALQKNHTLTANKLVEARNFVDNINSLSMLYSKNTHEDVGNLITKILKVTDQQIEDSGDTLSTNEAPKTGTYESTLKVVQKDLTYLDKHKKLLYIVLDNENDPKNLEIKFDSQIIPDDSPYASSEYTNKANDFMLYLYANLCKIRIDGYKAEESILNHTRLLPEVSARALSKIIEEKLLFFCSGFRSDSKRELTKSEDKLKDSQTKLEHFINCLGDLITKSNKCREVLKNSGMIFSQDNPFLNDFIKELEKFHSDADKFNKEQKRRIKSNVIAEMVQGEKPVPVVPVNSYKNAAFKHNNA